MLKLNRATHCLWRTKPLFYLVNSLPILPKLLIFTGSFEEDTVLPKGLENWNVERDAQKNNETESDKQSS